MDDTMIIEDILYGEKINIEEFIDNFKNLSESEQEKVISLLNSSLEDAKKGYERIKSSYANLKAFIRLQENILDMINNPNNNEDVHWVITPNSTEEEDTEYEESEYEEEQEDSEDDNPLLENRGRGRTPLINEIIQHFNLTSKASNEQEEVERINQLKDYNKWHNIGTEKTPHYVIQNATYVASIQFLEASSKNANYSILTRVMLNPSGAYFKGETVVIRNRYLEERDTAIQYLNRQMNKIEKQFFDSKAPDIIQNHGSRNSYYGFYLSKENRNNYKNVLQKVKI